MLAIADLPDQPFTSAQAVALGLTRRQLSEAVDHRQLRRVLRNVYLRSDQADSVENRARAARLVISDHAVACDRTAAWIHGVDVLTWRETEILPPIESFVLRWHTRIRRPEIAGGTRDLTPVDITEVAGVRVTTPLRTALDLGCRLARRDALAALDGFMRGHGLTQHEMLCLARRYRRRRGVVQLRTLIPLADPRAESPGESWTRLEVIDRGIPWPEPQYWIHIDGVPTYRLDFAWPRHRVALEYDGEEFHSSLEQRAHDEERRQWLRDHGWVVIVVDQKSFTLDASDDWIAELKAALRLRT